MQLVGQVSSERRHHQSLVNVEFQIGISAQQSQWSLARGLEVWKQTILLEVSDKLLGHNSLEQHGSNR